MLVEFDQEIQRITIETGVAAARDLDGGTGSKPMMEKRSLTTS